MTKDNDHGAELAAGVNDTTAVPTDAATARRDILHARVNRLSDELDDFEHYADDWYDAKDALIAAARAEGADIAQPVWQPIDTAPKDGTAVDLWVDGRREPDCHWGRLDFEIDYNGAERNSSGWAQWADTYDCYGCVYGEITHWMPLPEPPK